MYPEKRTGFPERGNRWGVGVPSRSMGWYGQVCRRTHDGMKLSTLVSQAHRVQGEMWDGGCRKGTFGIKSLYLF